MGIGHGVLRHRFLGRPLMRTGRALGQFPLELEQNVEIIVVPLNGVGGPRTLNAAADGVDLDAAAKAAVPAQALLLQGGSFRFRTHILFGVGGAMALAKGVATRHQRHRFFVIHGHAGKGFTDVPCRSHRVGPAIGAFRVDINQTHLHGGQGVLQFTVTAVALVVEPLAFGAPVNVFFWFPNVLAPARKPKGLETHRFERNVACENYQVSPGNAATILLLDWPN